MANVKLSALTELAATPALDDEVYIRDVSEAPADESKRITIANLMAAGIPAPALTIADFQENPATGDFTQNPELINDGAINDSYATVIAQYAEVDFGRNFFIYQWRQYGSTNNNGDGVWKIEYYDGSWHDWVTGISTRATADWTSFTGESGKICSKIRLTCTAVDTGFTRSYIAELEIKY